MGAKGVKQDDNGLNLAVLESSVIFYAATMTSAPRRLPGRNVGGGGGAPNRQIRRRRRHNFLGGGGAARPA